MPMEQLFHPNETTVSSKGNNETIPDWSSLSAEAKGIMLPEP